MFRQIDDSQWADMNNTDEIGHEVKLKLVEAGQQHFGKKQSKDPLREAQITSQHPLAAEI